ncbi:hypothetical protein ACJIZ3_010821 [Penstemon smallii]|uniref:ATPase n=1 Tax=Penstemon smallii TaxID=265156 RepID=A0ABD3UHD6_9LAMI
MLNVHSALQKHRSLEDPIEAVSLEICEESILLCLDEFMILVTTSNRAPENLYQGGLQRDLFSPFVATLKERCLIHEIGSSVDYRKLSLAGESRYFVGDDSSSLLRRKFQLLLGKHIAFGQEISVPLGANRCAYFTFEELCNRPLGAADYSALFNNFNALALEGVPIFGLCNRPAAYRLTDMNSKKYLDQWAALRHV